MTNTAAIVIALGVIGLITLDLTVLDSGASLFLARKGLDLLQVLAFWR